MWIYSILRTVRSLGSCISKPLTEISERQEWFERASRSRLLTSKSPLWRDEKLYFALPHGYSASTGRDIKDSAAQARRESSCPPHVIHVPN